MTNIQIPSGLIDENIELFSVDGKIMAIITPFEIKLIHLLASEDTIPVMAEKLHVCVNTLEKRKQKLYEKLGVLSRPRAVAIAYNLQILKLCL